jgi:hypothetical protein
MIAIAGDSWGCGLWGADVETINVSRPNGSNQDSINQLAALLDNSPHLKIDQAVVFQTEYIRDLHNGPKVTDNYQVTVNNTISNFYYRLSDLATKHNVQIQLVGGFSDTIWLDKFAQEYPGVNLACQSVTNLLLSSKSKINTDYRYLIHDDSVIDTPVFSTYSNKLDAPVIEQMKQNCGPGEVDQLTDAIAAGRHRATLWQAHPEWFSDDGLYLSARSCATIADYLISNQHIRKTI